MDKSLTIREKKQIAGRKGGLAHHSAPRGFAAMTPEQRKASGAKGGRISRKRPKKVL